MDANTSGGAGCVVRKGVRRDVDGCDDEDEVRKGGRRFKQAGTPNLHLLPVWRAARDGSRHSFLFSVSRLIRLEELLEKPPARARCRLEREEQ